MCLTYWTVSGGNAFHTRICFYCFGLKRTSLENEKGIFIIHWNSKQVTEMVNLLFPLSLDVRPPVKT